MQRRRDRGADERRWRRAVAIGGSVGLLVQAWMLTAGTWNPLRWGRQSDFYDAQARALLHGTLAIDQRVLGIESFARGDQHFMYFGPVPALLRIPFVAASRSLDGRLAAMSMFCALIVTFAAVRSVGWNLRERVARADQHTTVSRHEAIGAGLTMFAVIAGGSLLYASARTAIYHEAILWGVALTMATIAALLQWLDVDDINSGRARRLMLLVSVLALLAMLTRPSVAGGALAALGLVVAKPVVSTLLRRPRPAPPDTAPGAAEATWSTSAILVSAVALPVVGYSIVNWLKFRSLLSVPFDQQGYSLLSEQRREMLAANGGTLFNWKFVPTNLVSYLRPDLIGLDGTFPFVQPRRPVTTIGSPVYDLIDLTAGVPTTMPLLVVLSAIGVWAVARRPAPALRPLRLVLIGVALGSVAVLAIGYLANRYQSDFLPILIVAAFVGLPVATRRIETLPATQRRGRVIISGGVVALVGVGLLTNLALGYSYQRAYGPSTHPDDIAGYISTQQRVDGWFGDGRLSTVRVTDDLPSRSGIGDVAVIGACDALYLSDGGAPSDGRLTQWRLAELADGHRGRITLDADADQPVALLQLVAPERSITVVVAVDSKRGVMTTALVATGADGADGAAAQQRGPELPLRVGRPLEWEVFADSDLGRLEVFLDGRFAVFGEIPVGIDLAPVPEVGDGATATPVCDRLLASMSGAESAS